MVLRQIGLHQLGCLRLPQIYALPDENPPPLDEKAAEAVRLRFTGKTGNRKSDKTATHVMFLHRYAGLRISGGFEGRWGGRFLFGFCSDAVR